VFILDHKLHFYRVELFQLLAKKYSVTVVHRGPEIEGEFTFKQAIHTYSSIGPFEYISCLDLKNYNIVIYMQNIRLINVFTSLFFNTSRRKLLFWGIGTSSSKGLGVESLIKRVVRNIITLLSGGLALYSQLPMKQYWLINQKKITVVGNSLSSPYSFDSSKTEKEYILFLGSLNKRKGIIELLLAFSKSVKKHKHLKLLIVGEGPEYHNVINKISELGLVGSVEMLGAITCAQEKAVLYSKAFFVISPLQAGLGVVEAFSFGIPFVTSSNAITGGETVSIEHNQNGILFDDIGGLDDVINSFFDGRVNYSEMGHNAYHLYLTQLTIEQYANRFTRFIECE